MGFAVIPLEKSYGDALFSNPMGTSTHQRFSAWSFSLLLHLVLALAFFSLRLPAPSPSYTLVDLVGKSEKIAAPAKRSLPKTTGLGTSLPAQTTEATPEGSESSSGEAEARLLSLEETYISGVRSDLEKKKFYPPLARRLGQKGKLVLRITVAHDGSIASSELIEKTSFPLLNSAAQNLLYAVNRFQPFPDELKKSSITFNMPIVYSVE